MVLKQIKSHISTNLWTFLKLYAGYIFLINLIAATEKIFKQVPYVFDHSSSPSQGKTLHVNILKTN